MKMIQTVNAEEKSNENDSFELHRILGLIFLYS